MERDFEGRTVLKMITDFKMEPLLESEQINHILDSIYYGKAAISCDGQFRDFSKLYHIVTNDLKPLPFEEISTGELFSARFEYNRCNENFWWQYGYRMQSVQFVFIKEQLGSLFIVLYFQWVNYQYLTLFSLKRRPPNIDLE